MMELNIWLSWSENPAIADQLRVRVYGFRFSVWRLPVRASIRPAFGFPFRLIIKSLLGWYWASLFGGFLRHRVGIGFDEAARLAVPEFCVLTAELEQFGVGSLLHDPSLLDDDQAIERGDGRQAMRDGDDGLVAHQQLELTLDCRLDLAVERRGGLVQHQD